MEKIMEKEERTRKNNSEKLKIKERSDKDDAIVRLEGLGKLQKSTSSGLDPATFQLIS
jgi:hypothetical protein